MEKSKLIELVLNQIRLDIEANETLAFDGLEALLEKLPNETLTEYLPKIG